MKIKNKLAAKKKRKYCPRLVGESEEKNILHTATHIVVQLWQQKAFAPALLYKIAPCWINLKILKHFMIYHHRPYDSVTSAWLSLLELGA